MGIEVTDERKFNAERDQLRARVAELGAERNRLREALSLIAVMGFSGDNAVARRIGELAVEQARAALGDGQ